MEVPCSKGLMKLALFDLCESPPLFCKHSLIELLYITEDFRAHILSQLHNWDLVVMILCF